MLQSSGTFTAGPDLPEPIAQHCIEGVDDNRVFMSGGDIVGTNVGNKKAYMYSFVSQVNKQGFKNHEFIMMQEGGGWIYCVPKSEHHPGNID